MINVVCLGLAIFAAVYWLAAFASVVLSRCRRPSAPAIAFPVMILKPLRGNDGQLYENLRSFCLQDYHRFEIVFGVQHLHDPAAAHQGIFGLGLLLTIGSACGLVASFVVLPVVLRLITPGSASVVLCQARMPLGSPRSLGSGEALRK